MTGGLRVLVVRCWGMRLVLSHWQNLRLRRCPDGLGQARASAAAAAMGPRVGRAGAAAVRPRVPVALQAPAGTSCAGTRRSEPDGRRLRSRYLEQDNAYGRQDKTGSLWNSAPQTGVSLVSKH